MENNNYYNTQGNYPYQQPPQKNNNTIIILVSILGSLILILLTFGILIISGTIEIGNSNSTSDNSVISTSVPEAETPADTPAVTQVPASAPVSQAVTMYVANVKNSIYFRSAPAEVDSNIITTIPLGTTILLKETVDNIFAKIEYNGQEGYVKREYLASVPPTAAPVAAPSNNTVISTKYVANVAYAIYLRSTPSDNGSIICEIPLGTAVGFIETANSTFSKINYNGRIGYSKTEYLSSYQPGNGAGVASSSSSTLTVCNVKYAIYLRASASDNGSIICEIPVGSVVENLGRANSTFTKIRWNGTTGYSKTEYLR